MARKKKEILYVGNMHAVPGSRLWDDAGHAIHAVG